MDLSDRDLGLAGLRHLPSQVAGIAAAPLAAVRHRLAASAEDGEVTGRVLAAIAALQGRVVEEQCAAWLVLDAEVNHRGCVVIEAHFGAGGEVGITLAAARELDPRAGRR